MFVDFLAFALANGLTTPPVTRADLLPGLNSSPPERIQPFVLPQEWASVCKPWDDWDKPAPPYRIYGNTYYVGTCGIAAILITGDDGHVLIDTGTKAGAKIILANIRSLGFDPQDIEFLLQSHEHFDHVGGMAIVAQVTGGQVHASPEAGLVMMVSGEPLANDPQFGMHDPMQTISDVRFLKGNEQRWDEQVEAYDLDAGTKLKAHRTPGHSPGALSWQWKSCEGDRCLNIVYADSLSPVSSDDYKFSDHPEYVRAYFDGLDRLAALDCDILLTPHPSHSKMVKRAETGTFEGGVSCGDYAAGKHRDLDARLVKEAASE
ncbi:subclass B3 metallo-beta-lactamase [Erythrobacter sp. F6033]|uniref:subclass B3 metallo-beta-lactamase n=1 Tax=Erythrobacter sp. F6033 TaxID=2926401 RepID=UPI001FF2D316|nr:subclass B3 metallo-beta-lactamase [Erythrobacter sp. F6033]MCK0128187.1 subclass B3 metallo-beta-lactamase [Erythrobacter sp. F6033]